MVLKASHGFDRAYYTFLVLVTVVIVVRVELLKSHAEDVGTWSFSLCGLVGLWNLFSDIQPFPNTGFFQGHSIAPEETILKNTEVKELLDSCREQGKGSRDPTPHFFVSCIFAKFTY